MEIHHEELSDIVRYIERRKDEDILKKEPQFDGILFYIEQFKKVDSSLKMAEVGTGMGWLPTLAKMRGLQCKGIEISPMLVQAGREYGRRYGVEPDLEVGNIETSDLGENLYDVIIANSVFEHVEHWETGLRTIYRALKPGGILFFESTNKWSIASGELPPMPCYGWLPNWGRYNLRKVIHGADIMKNGIDFHQFTYPGLRKAFRRIGFRQITDRVALIRPERIANPHKRRLAQFAQSNSLVRQLVLTFIEVTTFVCVK